MPKEAESPVTPPPVTPPENQGTGAGTGDIPGVSAGKNANGETVYTLTESAFARVKGKAVKPFVEQFGSVEDALELAAYGAKAKAEAEAAQKAKAEADAEAAKAAKVKESDPAGTSAHGSVAARAAIARANDLQERLAQAERERDAAVAAQKQERERILREQEEAKAAKAAADARRALTESVAKAANALNPHDLDDVQLVVDRHMQGLTPEQAAAFDAAAYVASLTTTKPHLFRAQNVRAGAQQPPVQPPPRSGPEPKVDVMRMTPAELMEFRRSKGLPP